MGEGKFLREAPFFLFSHHKIGGCRSEEILHRREHLEHVGNKNLCLMDFYSFLWWLICAMKCYSSIFCLQVVFHCQSLSETATITKLISTLNKNTGEVLQKRPRYWLSFHVQIRLIFIWLWLREMNLFNVAVTRS